MSNPPKRIAIIGSGISGLTCGYLLHKNHQITLFEANDYIGGHTHTVDVKVHSETQAIDTGFIVFNDWTYPNFIKLMAQLGVASQPTEMSFSVKNTAENLEYNGNNLNTLFAQRSNLFNPTFLRMINDIVRFNKACKKPELQKQAGDTTLWQFIETQGYGDSFAYNYILPMCAAIWSTSIEDIKAFPLKFFLQFFNNHGLLNITDRPQWFTLIGGSRSYIAPITKGFFDCIHLNSAVTHVERTEQGILIRTNNEQHNDMYFDEVIFACHSVQALRMLANPSQAQQDILGAIKYASNEVVLHRDTDVLPERKLAWASWNYAIKDIESDRQRPATVTYNMNILQRLRAYYTYCVTLNDSDAIAADKHIQTFNYAHPQFNQQSMLAQQRRDEICGKAGFHFCGAYWYNGFHEDGVRSALDVCDRFGARL